MSTLFFNAQILTMTQSTPSLFSGAVGVVDNRIALVSCSPEQIAKFEEQNPAARKVDCKGKLLMPGLINTHTHSPMTLQRGTGDDVELMPWLNNIVWPFEAQQTDEDIEAGSRLGIVEMLLGGTTTFVDMYWSEEYVANAVEQLGIRAVLGESCLVGERMELFERNFPRLIERAAKCGRITVSLAPHAPYTCSPEILKRCVELSQKHDLPLMIHLAETLFEEQTIREQYDMTPTEYLDSCGMITDRTILAHSIYLTESDMEIIAKRGAHIAHNPQCNMKLSSGVAPIATLIEKGVNCTIGTDGVCSNNDLDMWDEMRTAAFLQKLHCATPTVLPAYEILKMSTVNGAAAIGHAGELGVIAEGALADIILVDIMQPHYRPHHNIISSLVYCSRGSDVESVMVNGKLVVEGGELLGVDVEAICQDVEARSGRIFESFL